MTMVMSLFLVKHPVLAVVVQLLILLNKYVYGNQSHVLISHAAFHQMVTFYKCSASEI